MADADAITEATAKLVLDDVTGEMVSKNELKKRTQKRAKKAATEKAKAAAAASQEPGQQKAPKPKAAKPEESVVDTDAIFKLGFLDDVSPISGTKMHYHPSLFSNLVTHPLLIKCTSLTISPSLIGLQREAH